MRSGAGSRVTGFGTVTVGTASARGRVGGRGASFGRLERANSGAGCLPVWAPSAFQAMKPPAPAMVSASAHSSG
jgi:hypothetical protein